MDIKLGKLTEVSPRDVWQHEAHGFTPWLLENADELAEAIGIDLDLTTKEHPVGKFYLDLLGQDLTHDCPVMVENQLTTTDHDHLGKLVTYAAGTKAQTVIWIATEFREEHREALDFLNDLGGGKVRFFGVEVGAVKIGDSLPAPLFRVLAKPNDWAAQTSAAAKVSATSGVAPLYVEFWTRFLARVAEEHPAWTTAKVPQAVNWIVLPAAVTGCNYDISFAAKGRLRNGIYIDTGDADTNTLIFNTFRAHQAEIEAAYGHPLTWEELEGKQACRIAEYGEGKVAEVDQHDAYVDWWFDRHAAFRAAVEPFFPAVEAALKQIPSAAAPTVIA